jgi:hypothetical protein
MTKRKTTTASAAALTYAEALAIPSASRIPRFQLEASTGQRAFSAMAKLFRVIEKSLPSGETIFPLLMRAGIKKGTVSNASIAASVFDLVEAGTMTEAEFDALSFNDCWQNKRVLSSKSRKQLTTDEAVAMIRKNPDFAEEFATLFEHGLTAKEFMAKETKTSTAASKPPQQKADLSKTNPTTPPRGNSSKCSNKSNWPWPASRLTTKAWSERSLSKWPPPLWTAASLWPASAGKWPPDSVSSADLPQYFFHFEPIGSLAARRAIHA